MIRFSEPRIVGILEQVRGMPSEALESEDVEFKEYRDEQALHNSKDLAEELSALANKNGGVIIVGVRDSSNVKGRCWDSQLVGIPAIDVLSTQERIKGKLQPLGTGISVWQMGFEQKNFVVIEIESRPDSLVSTSSGKVCIRDGRSSRPMSPMEIRDAVSRLTSYDWSAQLLDEPIDDALDPSAVQSAMLDFSFKRKLPGINAVSYLEAIDATRDGKLTAGGLLFLGREATINRILGEFEYRFSWKMGNGELLLNDVWSGSLWNTIFRAKQHFSSCNKTLDFNFENVSFSVPRLDDIAFHEAFLNALVHRDYSIDGMVSVAFTGKQLIVTSPGGFIGGVTAENIALHEPRHRNKNLAKIMMSHGLVDRAGMGILRMGIRSLAYGRGLPSFKETHDTVEVRIDAEYLRPVVAALFSLEPDQYDIVDLVLLNQVYGKGAILVSTVEHLLGWLVAKPWESIQESVEKLEQVEFCGRRDGVYIRVVPKWRESFKVTRSLRTTTSSSKHVRLYGLLKQHGQVSNADVRELLGHSYSSQTSKFLRDAKYVGRQGSGVKSRWSLVK